jgi:DNA uptake protein ComE-like DNA-binding protein
MPEKPSSEPAAPSAPAASGDQINLNEATFEDLRDLGFSVTQATRVITYRERASGFDSLDDLSGVPGMPRSFLKGVLPKLKL